MRNLLMAATVALVVGAGANTPSLAHMSGDSPGTMGMGMGMGMGMMGGDCPMTSMMGGQGYMGQGMGHMMGQGMGHMAAVADGRLAFLKTELGITDAQKTVWENYARVVRDRATGMQDMHQGMMAAMQADDMIGRMDARISSMEAMLDAMKAVKPAAEELYAALSDEQKQRANHLVGMDCGGL